MLHLLSNVYAIGHGRPSHPARVGAMFLCWKDQTDDSAGLFISDSSSFPQHDLICIFPKSQSSCIVQDRLTELKVRLCE